MHTVLIIGGDSRQDYLEQYLRRGGFPVLRWPGPDGIRPSASRPESIDSAMELADIIVCPVPFTKNGSDIFDSSKEKADNEDCPLAITAFLSSLKSSHTLFGGAIPKQVVSHCSQLKIPVYDFMKMEEVALKNTVATAEGAIAEAITLSPGVLHGSRCLIIGFGRCGETLAGKLKGLDAQVTAADRSAQRLALAYAKGCFPVLMEQPFSEHSTFLSDFDFIFNTVPEPVLGPSVRRLLKEDAALIDIASAPGGIHLDNAKQCPGLPGRYCPKAAAEILYQAILEHLPQ